MATFSSSRSSSRGQISLGFISLAILTVFGALHLNVMGQSVALTLLPFIGICLWPRYAHPILSIVIIFVMGLLMDFATNEPLGFRTLIYLTIFSVFRPDKRIKQHVFVSAFLQWFGILILAVILTYGLGWFVRGTRPDIYALINQAILATALFPVAYIVRIIFRYFLTDPDERY